MLWKNPSANSNQTEKDIRMKTQLHNPKSEFRSPNEIRGPNSKIMGVASDCAWDFARSASSRRAVASSQRVGVRPLAFSLQPSVLLLLCLLTSALCSPAFAQGTAFTYQGRLNDGASPANGIYDLRFTIYDSTNSPGVVIAGPITNSSVGVSDGLFTALLDFGAAPFNGADRWLDIGVRTNGGGAFTSLAPRQPITPTPYALSAANLMSFSGQPLEIKVSGARVLRIEPTTNSPNWIGGFSSNFVANGVVGATIAGGGATNYAGLPAQNPVTADFGTVAGGAGNSASLFGSIGGGLLNTNSDSFATIGGGFRNLASGDISTVVGGQQNTAGGFHSTVAGGLANGATGDNSAVVGGFINNANDVYYAVASCQQHNAL